MIKFCDFSDFFNEYQSLTEEEAEILSEYLSDDGCFDDCEVKASYYRGCLIIRFYSDGAGYHFEAPIEITECADVSAAFVAISEYCVAEAIPETVVGIPPEYKDMMLRGALRYEEGEDEDGTSAIRILTECMLEEDLPEIMVDDVYLGEFAFAYAGKYEELLKNVNLNKHFGYNILDDMPDGNGIDFINSAREEFERGESMTFAATVLSENGENIFVGEGCLFAFNGRGEVSLAFRVLPEWHRRGIGTKIFVGLIKISRRLGLTAAKCEIKKENLASVALVSKYATSVYPEKDKNIYIIGLDKVDIH